MNSIFLRIYGGMLLAMVLIALVAWGAIEGINSWRSDSYRERITTGTFWLAASSTGRFHGEERKRWLASLSRVMGSPVTEVDAATAALSAAELARLRDGRVLFRLAENDEGPAALLMGIPAESGFISVHLSRLSEQQWRATVILVLEELSRHPQARWDAVLAGLQQHFGYPLSLLTLSEVVLDAEQLQRLYRREVVIQLSESGPAADSGIRVYAPVGNTGDVLMLGPMRLFDRLPLALVIPVGAVALMFMGLAAYLLVRPLERRLNRLDSAVQEVSAGNLSARADVPGADAVGRLAASFNGMTAHISRLIEAQREMTRAVSHELRTPVARIRFGLEMVADTDDAALRAERVAAIDHDIDQLDSLIDEILTYARLEEGTPALQFVTVDIAALARQVCREVQPMAGNLRLEVDAPAELLFSAEERYLHRLLQNLVGNATRYARTRVRVHCRVDGQLAELVVEDDGPGIPVGDRERVFKPFARLDDSRQRASGGYGLGLSIVQRIAEWHGGRVWVDTGALGGAAFHLRWPRAGGSAHVLAGGGPATARLQAGNVA